MARNKELDVKTAKIKLTAPHNDNGIDYKPGDVLELREDQVDWLVCEGRGERVGKREPAANAPESEQTGERAGSAEQSNAAE
jgi:hypothetical protein